MGGLFKAPKAATPAPIPEPVATKPEDLTKAVGVVTRQAKVGREEATNLFDTKTVTNSTGSDTLGGVADPKKAKVKPKGY